MMIDASEHRLAKEGRNDLISIVVPAFGVEDFIDDFMGSILNQTYDNFECICIDDGSPDRTGDILDRYQAKDPRVRVIHTKNEGVGAARNRGIENSRGEYIAILDPDDLFHSRFLEILHGDILQHGVDFACCGFSEVGENASFSTVRESAVLGDSEPAIYRDPVRGFFLGKSKACVVVWNKLYKAEEIQALSFAENLHPGEDDLFTFQLISRVSSFSVRSTVLVSHRVRSGSAMSSFKIDNNYAVARLLAEFLRSVANRTDSETAFLSRKVSRKIYRYVLADPIRELAIISEETMSTCARRMRDLEEDGWFQPTKLSRKELMIYRMLCQSRFRFVKFLVRLT